MVEFRALGDVLNFTGSDQADSIFGYAGDNTFLGEGGNDFITGGEGNDRLWGNDGHDTLKGGGDNDSLYGGNGNDSLVAGYGNDELYGGNGNDTIRGVAGDNIVKAGGGDDRIVTGNGNDTIFGQGGNDIIRDGGGNDILNGGGGADTLYSFDGNDTMYGGSGDDRFLVATNSDGSASFEFINAGSGNDSITLEAGTALTSNYTVDGSNGIDALTLVATANTTVDANDLANIKGFENLVFKANDANKLYNIDLTLTSQLLSTSAVSSTMNIDAGNQNFALNTSLLSDADVVNVANVSSFTLADDSEGRVNVIGAASNGGDIIYSSSVDGQTLTGTSKGDDITIHNLASKGVFNAGEGNDIVRNIGLSDNTIHGGAGDDIFFIKGKESLVTGGIGNDLFISQTANVDFSRILGNGGTDTFQVGENGRLLIGSFSFDASDLERIIDNDKDNIVDGSTSTVDSIEVLGNVGSDYIIGSALDDTLSGGKNNDTIVAGAGDDIVNGDNDNDSLLGGNGDDTLTGGIGNDYISGGAGKDFIDMMLGADSVEGGTGADQFIFSENGSRNAEVWDFNISEGDRISIKDNAGQSIAAANILITDDINSVASTGIVAEHADTYLTTLYSSNTVIGYIYHTSDVETITGDIFI